MQNENICKMKEKIILKILGITILLSHIILSGCSLNSEKKEKDNLKVDEDNLCFEDTVTTTSFFRYKGDGSIQISGHRGGLEPGFPENSLEGLQNVISQMPAFFEIDPRLTQDSVIVLMHDEFLDRTTTGSGRLSEYAYDQLDTIRLKDREGNVTPFKIPRLDDVIVWSRGKIILNLDKKDVPYNMIVDIINKYNVQNHIMLTVHTGAQARYYYDRFPGILLSVFARNEKEYDDILISGVPWKNMIAYVGPDFNEKNKMIVKKLRDKGVRCMVSYSPTIDKLTSSEERQVAYKDAIELGPDIIESDFPTEVWSVICRK